jgi:hypothetical protein
MFRIVFAATIIIAAGSFAAFAQNFGVQKR